jgi:hypothetical protein
MTSLRDACRAASEKGHDAGRMRSADPRVHRASIARQSIA